jgi:hypothetical protein
MNLRVAFAIAVTAAVAACTPLSQPGPGGGGGPGSGHGRPACKPGSDCSTTVSATLCSIPEPEVITVEDGSVDLVWNLDPGVLGYTFDGKGIIIRQDPNDEFSTPRVTGNRVTIHDKNTHRGEHKYTVSIRNRFATCTPLDPTIVNRG